MVANCRTRSKLAKLSVAAAGPQSVQVVRAPHHMKVQQLEKISLVTYLLQYYLKAIAGQFVLRLIPKQENMYVQKWASKSSTSSIYSRLGLSGASSYSLMPRTPKRSHSIANGTSTAKAASMSHLDTAPTQHELDNHSNLTFAKPSICPYLTVP